MIHLVNGASTLNTLQETSVAGDKHSVDDILMEGPILDGLRTESSWRVRAEYLERLFSIPATDYLAGNTERDKVLRESLNHDEIVLWFEFDLFCQINLLYLLSRFAAVEQPRSRLTLICPDKFLGSLNAGELESLFPLRTEVTCAQMSAASEAWQAYGNADPRAIERFLQSDSGALPLLAPALRAHLERFPSTTNGLGILGQKTLEILAQESLPFPALFQRVTTTPEIGRHGVGDVQLQAYLKMWAAEPSPLITSNSVFEITDAGRSVIENRADAIRPNGFDLWYGGVHLSPDNQWRWNSKERSLKIP